MAGITLEKVKGLLAREEKRYVEERPKSKALLSGRGTVMPAACP